MFIKLTPEGQYIIKKMKVFIYCLQRWQNAVAGMFFRIRPNTCNDRWIKILLNETSFLKRIRTGIHFKFAYLLNLVSTFAVNAMQLRTMRAYQNLINTK